jgi:HKD family nuclease
MRTEDIYEWVGDELRDGDDLRREQVENALGDRTEDALFLLEFLVSRGVLTSQRQGNTVIYSLVDGEGLEELISRFGTDEPPLDETAADHDARLPAERQAVVSVPLDMQSDLDALQDEHPDVGVLTLRAAAGQLLAAAESDVRLAVPFFEQSGLNTLLDEVTGLAARGVNLRVLTRGIQTGDGYDHTNKCRALAKLHDLYTANKQVDGDIEIRDFGERITGHPDNPSRHYRGIHQKMIVSDAAAAYIGSGEIRENSFLTNGEAGMLTVTDPEVAFWVEFYDLFWRQATPVTDTVLHAVR